MNSDVGWAAAGLVTRKIERVGLLCRLETARGAGITLIEGGAGWGKSELLRQWAALLHRRNVPVVWIDPTVPDLGARLGALRLVAPAPGLLIIDDWHKLDSDCARRLVAEMVRNPPGGAHIAIASRERIDTELSHRWLGRTLLRLRQVDLQMSAEEAQELLGPSLNPAQLMQVMEWSEGWPALLGHVREHLLTGAHLDCVLDSAARHDSEVFRFIAEQILSPLPPLERELLTRTAFLPDFCGDLARALAGNGKSGQMLTSLEKRLLIAAQNTEPPRSTLTYRAHPLVREVLRQELARRGRGEWRRLHRIAAGSLHSLGDVASAVRCACNGGEYSFAAHVILSSGGLLYGVQHGTAALRRLLELLPGDVVRQHPRLALAEAYILINDGLLDIAREIIETVRRGLQSTQRHQYPKRTGSLRGDLAIVDIVLSISTSLGSIDEKIALLERGIETADASELLSLGTFHNLLAWMHFRRGHLDLAASQAQCALHYYSRGAAPYGSAYTRLLLGLIDMEHARPDSAIQHYECARNLFTPPNGGDNTRDRELSEVVLAEAFYEQGRLAEARGLCEPAVGRLSPIGYSLIAVTYRTLGSLTACDRGRQATAALFDHGVSLARKKGAAALARILELYRRESALLGGEVISPDDSAEDTGEASDWREHDARLFLQARSAIHAQKREVVNLLQSMIADFERDGRVRSQIDALVLLALAQCQRGESEASVLTLGTAIRLGAPRCLQRPFLEHARTLAPLLLRVREQSKSDCEVSFIHRVLAIGTTTAAAAAISFSQRELEVLRLLAFERKNKSIARELRISPETVRFHLKNVYEKLGSKDRMLVAQIARERGIIADAI